MLTFSVGRAGEAEGPKLRFVMPRLTWLKLLLWVILALFLLSSGSFMAAARKESATMVSRANALALVSARAV